MHADAARWPTSPSRPCRERRAARRSSRRLQRGECRTLFFRLTVGDGFGASAQSTNLSVTLTEHRGDGAVRDPAHRHGRDEQHHEQHDGQPDLQRAAGDARRHPEPGADRSRPSTPTARPDSRTRGATSLPQVATRTARRPASSPAALRLHRSHSRRSRCRNTAQIFLRLTVSDAFGLASTTINFTLNRLANTAPTVTANGPAFVTIGTGGVQLTGTATDPQTSAYARRRRSPGCGRRSTDRATRFRSMTQPRDAEQPDHVDADVRRAE